MICSIIGCNTHLALLQKLVFCFGQSGMPELLILTRQDLMQNGFIYLRASMMQERCMSRTHIPHLDIVSSAHAAVLHH